MLNISLHKKLSYNLIWGNIYTIYKKYLNYSAIFVSKNTLYKYKRDIQIKRVKAMANLNLLDLEETFNPFEAKLDAASLRSSLDEIDNRDIRTKFKNTQDPINLAFQTIENTSLKTLAKDFVKESFYDFISCVKDICR